MIKVSEIFPPIKLSGLSSLVIQFNYNEAIINAIKTIGNCIYHKKLQLWEAPINKLSQILDTLTIIDDIQLQLLPDNFNKCNSGDFDLTEAEIEQFRFKPFKHQIEGINFLLRQKKSLLLDSMGIGKSLQLMYFAETLHRRGLIDHCLLVCGVDSLRSNWKAEIEKFSNESVLVLGEKINRNGKIIYESIPKRVERLKTEISEFFVVVNIATLRDDKIIEAISKGPNKFGMIAVDEIHKCLTGDSTIYTERGNLSLEELSKLDTLPKVLSYNVKTGKNEFKQVSNIIISEPIEDIVELVVEDNLAQYSIKCTESHKIYTTNRGWVKAKDLTFEDDIKIIS